MYSPFICNGIGRSTFIITLSLLILVSPAMADDVYLNSGEVIKGQVISQDDQTVKINHRLFGEVTIPASEVQSVVITEPPAEPEAAAVEQPEKAEAEKIEEKPFGDSAVVEFLREWNTSFEIGFNTSDGNTVSKNLYVGLNMKKETTTDIDRVRFKYRFESDDNQTTTSEGFIAWDHDWLLQDSPWLLFLTTKLETDEFKAWDYRFTGLLGAGYKWIDEDNLTVTPRVGAGGNQQFGSDNNKFNPELLLGVDVDYSVNSWLSLESSVNYLPGLESLDDYRLLATIDFIVKLNETLDLKFGISEEYDSTPEPGDEPNDLKTYGALVINFN